MSEINDTSAARADNLSDGKNKKKRDRPKRQPIESFGEFLRILYGGEKRVVLSKADFQQIRKAARLDANDRETLLQLAGTDKSLDRTRELMLMGMDWIDAPHLADLAFDFARQVLLSHPFFQAPSLNEIFNSNSSLAEGLNAVRTLLKQPLADKTTPNELTKKDIARCRSNALSCLLIWFRKKHEMPMENLLQILLVAWAPSASRNKDNNKKLIALLGTRDPNAVVAACSILDEKVNESRRQAESVLLAKDKIEARALSLDEALATTTNDHQKATARISELERELSQARSSHADSVAHMRDDYQELRGRVLNRLREELSLLEEGLDALRRDPPKIHVMTDHADRAIAGLRREMNRLKGDL